MSFAVTRMLVLQQLVLMIPRGLKETVRAVLFPPRPPLAAPVEWLDAPPVRRQERQPLISVVIPCYNYGRFLDEAIASVRAQTLRDLEIIVVDDGSTDDVTHEVLKALENSGDVTVMRQENQGAPAARNVGLRVARGLYVCCLDADDTMEPTYLEKCVLLMEGNAGVSLAYSWLRVTGSEERIWKSESLDLDRLRYYNHVSISAVFRREVGLSGGGFCAAMREGYEDWEFWLRLGAEGHRGEVIPEPLVNYRRHPAAFMNRARKRHAELFDHIYRRNREVFEDADVRRTIRRGYRDRPVIDPFANLDDRRQYDQDRPMVLLVLSGRDQPGLEERISRTLGDGTSLCLVRTGKAAGPERSPARAGGYTLGHILAAGFHGPFIRHLAVTRPVRAVLWLDPGPEPVGWAELSTLAEKPLLGVVTFPGDAPPRGLGLRLMLRPDGSLDGAEPLVAALRP
ncbi:glycosyltransferase family 2 protein [Skermanella pratensis]|uniref:glycosyltransferase family 2 protein n=1 Tax=Skermanella pratensis TaxID=2233999 RepID=UPI0013012C32|nr:glycosyltransferase family A protein [Skermanella pratensis]